VGIVHLPGRGTVENAVLLRDIERPVTQERVGEREGVGERLLGEGVVLADAEDLDAECAEPVVIGRPSEDR
jgi:hypothetical protein